MEDSIEITVTINSDSFPLLFRHLASTKAGRRRAAALKLLAENFLFIQQQNKNLMVTASPQVVEPPHPRDSPESVAVENSAQGALDLKSVRNSMSQFISG
ncbi:hypothetical protein [Paraburkholderia steynii]|uniref:hypothetical protein n=1 Tax=Paraburkholderia steynii TaxID=1245441 RepID=UPI00115FAFB1|nr:hypothetical protein [Paraburkholderia steynii]